MNPATPADIVDVAGSRNVVAFGDLTVRIVGRNRPTVIFRHGDTDVARAAVYPWIVLAGSRSTRTGELHFRKVSGHNTRDSAVKRMRREYGRSIVDEFAVVRLPKVTR